MRRVAEVELIHLPEEVESCCIIYLPHVGYLLAFPPSPSLDQTLNAQDYHLPGLEFMFKTADMVLYKSQTCLELDRELGDIQVEIANHETRIMMRLVEVLLQQAQQFLALLHHILMLDCLLAFSVVSRECGWVRPELTEEPVLEIEEARHPLYELCTPTFVANPVRSGRPHQCITLVTGPNASGKTVGVLAILAQVGCWVPASRARLRPLEAIIAVTQTTPPVTSALSTFMLDLTRMCTALARATQFSLVIIDEFGAATYENDGAALLTACLDHWCKQALPGHTPNNNRLSREREAGKGTRNSGSRRKGDEDSSRRSSRSERGEGSSRSRGSDEGRDEGPAVQEAPPHVFVSTHLLQVYDHLLYPEAVRC
ncbi:mutS protein 5-like, partial [Homarus americanus]